MTKQIAGSSEASSAVDSVGRAAEPSPQSTPTEGLATEAREQIAAEEQVVQQVLLSLESQRAIGGKRLKSEAVRAQQLTSRIVASRRDVDKQLLASDEAVSHRLVDMKQSEIESIDNLDEKYRGQH